MPNPERQDPMAEMKFSCPECGQHIAYGEPWAGRQIQCPTCHSNIVVPQLEARSTPPVAAGSIPESAKSAKLSAGVTQVPRSTAHAPAATPKSTPRPPRSENPLLKYAVLVVVIAALGWVGYFYGLPLLTSASQEDSNAKPPAGAKTSQSAGGRRGPMGEVNEAMDVSEALDAGSSAKARPVATTNATAHPKR